MKYSEEIYIEVLKNLRKTGLVFEQSPNNSEATIFTENGQEIGKVRSDCKLFIKPGQRDSMNSVIALKASAEEYVSAYSEAPALVATDLPKGYRIISNFGGYVFAAKQMADTNFEFVTWEYSYDRLGVGHGNYFRDYEAAKTDFAVRTGMIDRSKIFSENEIRFLYNHLSHYLGLNNYISFDDEKDVQALLEKMKEIVPECHSEHMSATEPNYDFDEEPGMD